MSKNVVIAGTGFPEVIQIISDINSSKVKDDINLLGFIDDNLNNSDKKIENYNVLGGFDWLKNNKNTFVFNSIARTTSVRLQAKERLDHFKAKYISLIHPNVNPSFSKVGKGVFIGKNVYLGINTEIGDGCIIQENCSIGHDVKIDKNCFIAPGCNILGKVNISENCYIGSGSVIHPDTKIGHNVTLGMNVALTNDAEPNHLYYVRPPYKMVSKNEIS